MKTHWILLASSVFLALFSLAGCGLGAYPVPGDTGNDLSTQPPPTSPAHLAQLSQPQTLTPPGDQSIENVKSASRDLAQKLGISVNDITISTIIGEEFSTIAFYCKTTKDRIAKDDPPAVISGFTILLNASGRRYEYHASGQTVVFCRPLP
jgi:hypothetical protein